VGWDASLCWILLKLAKWLLRCHIFFIFQDGSCPPSWMCLPCFWTTHEAYLVVFTSVQNLVVICRGFDNMKLWIFRTFCLKMRIHTPKITILEDLTPSIGRYINRTPERLILAWKDVMWCIGHQNWSTVTTCVRDEEIKKDRKKPYCGKLAIRPDNPRLPIKIVFGMVAGSNYKFQVSWTSVTKLCGVKIWLISLLRPMDYTTAIFPYGCDSSTSNLCIARLITCLGTLSKAFSKSTKPK